jgi:hypothetical protein
MSLLFENPEVSVEEAFFQSLDIVAEYAESPTKPKPKPAKKPSTLTAPPHLGGLVHGTPVVRSPDVRLHSNSISAATIAALVSVSSIVPDVGGSEVNKDEPQLIRSEPIGTHMDLATHFRKLNARMQRFGSLAAGWNGRGSIAPTPTSMEMAKRLIREFALTALVNSLETEPQLAPLDDGGLQFEWRQGERELFVACNADGSVHVYEAGPGHEREYDLDELDANSLRPSIAWLVEKVQRTQFTSGHSTIGVRGLATFHSLFKT